MDHESFKTMAMYLLFSATYNEVPLASLINMKVKENLEKSGSAKNAAFWNWTPLQKSLLDANLPRVIMTSHWSTTLLTAEIIKWQKCAHIGLNGFHIKCIIGTHCN